MSVAIVFLSYTLEIDLWESFVQLLEAGEAYEIDEWIIPAFLILIGLALDAVLMDAQTKKLHEKVDLYNHMNEQMMDEISVHLTKLLEFRTALMKDAPKAHDVRHELDRMIVKSFNHYERSQRRGNIDSSLMDLVMPSNSQPSTLPPPADDESMAPISQQMSAANKPRKPIQGN
ncbi:MAG: hypothetical protein HC765_11335 [Brachymonas sp.]|nr:hypothetical protein [Brachymonas sp.]